MNLRSHTPNTRLIQHSDGVSDGNSDSTFQEDSQSESSYGDTDSLPSYEARQSCGKRKTPTAKTYVVPPSKKVKLSLEGDKEPGLDQLYEVEEHLETTTFLQTYNCFIHSRRYIFCGAEGCRRFLTVKEATTHFMAKHYAGRGKARVKQELEKTLKSLEKALNLLTDKSSILQDLDPDYNKRKPFSHIIVKKGFKCPFCILAYTTLESLRAHAYNIHRQSGSSVGVPVEVNFQSIWIMHKEAGQSTSIIVNPEINNELIQEARPSDVDLPWFSISSVTEHSSLHQRQELEHFKTIGYMQRIQGISTDAIGDSLKTIQSSALGKCLTALSIQYLVEAQKEICTIQARQPKFLDIFKCPSLNGNTPFRLLIKDTSLARYGHELANLIKFIFHISTSPHLAKEINVLLSKTQEEAGIRLKTLLEQFESGATSSMDMVDKPTVTDENAMVDSDVESDFMGEDYLMADSDVKLDFRDTKCMEALHHTLLSVFSWDVKDSFNDLNLLPSFLVFRSLDTKSGYKRFKEPKLLTSPYAMFKFVAKTVCAREFHKLSDGGQTRALAGPYEALIYWITSDITPYDWLCRKLGNLSNYVLAQSSPPSISWFNQDMEDCYMTFHGTAIHMSKMKQFIWSIMDEVELSFKTLLHDYPLQPLQVEALKTKPTDDSYNYSCLDILMIQSEVEKYYHYLVEHNRLKGSVAWDLEAVDGVLSRAKRFIIYLSLAIYFTSGMPPRGEELVGITVRNTLHSNRNIYWHGCDLVIKGGHYKPSNLGNRDSPVVRIIAPQISVTLIYYQVVVLPAIYRLHKAAKPRDFTGVGDPYYTHLFVAKNKVLLPAELSKEMSQLSKDWFGEAFGLLDWRQILAGVSRKFIALLEPDYSVLEFQFGHGQTVGARHYGILEDNFSGIPYNITEQQLRLSRAWQALWGLRSTEVFLDTAASRFAQRVSMFCNNEGNLTGLHSLNPMANSPWG